MEDKIREECGLFGIYANKKTDVVATTYMALFALQHRGQESCGIVVNDDGLFREHKDIGLVEDVMTRTQLEKLGEGNMAMGHVRYSMKDKADRSCVQPVVVNHMKGRAAFAHNGNIINAPELRQELEMQGSIFAGTGDTETISHVIIKERLRTASIEEALSRAMGKLKGAYSLIIMSPAKMIAARDMNGYRPLCYGMTEDGSYIVASESCALDAVGAEFVRDILPGEIVVFKDGKVESRKEHCGKATEQLCIFEYIYFARPDSVISGCSVHEVRKKAGACLARSNPIDADVVIGVPDSGLDAALGYALESGIPYGLGFIKNRYIARTFISPSQTSRATKIKIKLNPVASTVAGKRVVLVDDSIVRGTTSRLIVKLLREAGATEVHMVSSAPKFLNPCYYGTDIDSRENLIACSYSTDKICEQIGADSLTYLRVEDLDEIVSNCNVTCCKACFDGKYATEIPEPLEASRYSKRISE